MSMTEKLAAFADATNSNAYDPAYEGGTWMVEAVETSETLEQWVESSDGWAKCSREIRGEVAGFPFVGWSNSKGARGHLRLSMTVDDFGELQIGIDFDPNYR